jgi:hypothetical protein
VLKVRRKTPPSVKTTAWLQNKKKAWGSTLMRSWHGLCVRNIVYVTMFQAIIGTVSVLNLEDTSVHAQNHLPEELTTLSVGSECSDEVLC